MTINQKNALKPWLNEPDELAWTDKVTGLKCLILRHELGHLCGYVQSDLTDIDSFDVHGGITFRGRFQYAAGLWLGFDCAHAGDLIPELSVRANDAIYRTLEYVTRQVEKLALQVSKHNEAKAKQ